MTVLGIPLSWLVPGLLGLYALTFIAGGIYYLEQRVERIRDQFHQHAILACLIGWTAMAIGILAALSAGGQAVFPDAADFRLAGLVAGAAGVAFWTHHLYVDLTARTRVRDGLLGLLCTALTALVALWTSVV